MGSLLAMDFTQGAPAVTIHSQEVPTPLGTETSTLGLKWVSTVARPGGRHSLAYWCLSRTS